MALLGQAIFRATAIILVFRFNPTQCDPSSGATPAELCGDDRLYFSQTNKCYLEYQKGPCGELMMLKASAKDINKGECHCEAMRGYKDLPKTNSTCPMRPKVFWQETFRCFYIFDQGPCKPDEWLVPYEGGAPRCERIPCPKKYKTRIQQKYYSARDNRFVFAHEGKCYLSISQNQGKFCSSPEEYLYFIDDSFVPQCGSTFACSATSPISNDCPDGSSPDSYGGCEPNSTIY